MTTIEAREDLLRGLLQSCYVIERARASVQRRWGGEFDRDAEVTTKRAERLGRLLDERGFRRPEEVCEPHADWFQGLCGAHPEDVPLGAAVLHQFGKWSDIFAAPYLGDDVADFTELGKVFTRVELDFHPMTEDEALLEPEPVPPGRRFAILTDIHVGSRSRDKLAKIAVADINALDVEFVVIPGDITEDGEPEQFHEVKAILDGLNCPYHVVPGNHDAIQRSTREPRCEEFWRAAFGTDPVDHVIEIGDLQIALVDSTDPTASPFPDWDVSKGEFGGEAAGVDSGALRPGQPQEIADRLDKTKPVLLVQHHELHPFPGFPPVKFALREEDAQAELDALKDHNLVGVVAGHTHRSARLPVGDGSVTQLEIPSLKDWPFAFSVAGVGDDGVQIAVRQISDRNAAWDMSRSLIPLMRRFAIGPLSDLSARLPFSS
jgi:hypothetical protein